MPPCAWPEGSLRRSAGAPSHALFRYHVFQYLRYARKEALSLGLFRKRFVISQLTRRELKRKYARSRLGIVWSVLAPLLSMVILSLIFSQLFKRSIENYPIYYLSGYLIWQALTGATTSAMTALVDNRALLLKIKFPMEIF